MLLHHMNLLFQKWVGWVNQTGKDFLSYNLEMYILRYFDSVSPSAPVQDYQLTHYSGVRNIDPLRQKSGNTDKKS